MKKLSVLLFASVFLFSIVGKTNVAKASVLSTTDPIQVIAFQSGRTVLGFDEIVVPPPLSYIPLDPNEYAAIGIIITAQADGSDQTHVFTGGHFGSQHSPPNIIGGGVSGSEGWRETVRFDFPSTANAIGAHNDASGSNTTLTAYRSDGSIIASVSGDQGAFMGIAEPGIAYATWNYNYTQSVSGFSLDNVTFSLTPTLPIPTVSEWGMIIFFMLLVGSALWVIRRQGQESE